jgi:serine/threonine-protein kinase ULK/ATG1
MKVRWVRPKEASVLTDDNGGGAALSWFKDHFLRCNDRAALVKTWLPAQYTGPSTWVDELVYNRALTLVRIPSLSFHHFLHLTTDPPFLRNLRVVQQRAKSYSISTSRPMSASAYTKSRCGVCMRYRTTCYRRAIRLWRRTVTRSPLVRTTFALRGDNLAKILMGIGIKRTKLRLVRCRARMEMPTRERLRDARADKNLDDVARIPAPWDAEALEQFHREAAPQ